MKTPSINLKRSLDITIKDTYQRIKKLSKKDSQALREEYKEWLEVEEKDKKHPHVLYINQLRPKR